MPSTGRLSLVSQYIHELWIKIMKNAHTKSPQKKPFFLIWLFFDFLDKKYEGICPEVSCTKSAITKFVF